MGHGGTLLTPCMCLCVGVVRPILWRRTRRALRIVQKVVLQGKSATMAVREARSEDRIAKGKAPLTDTDTHDMDMQEQANTYALAPRPTPSPSPSSGVELQGGQWAAGSVHGVARPVAASVSVSHSSHSSLTSSRIMSPSNDSVGRRSEPVLPHRLTVSPLHHDDDAHQRDSPQHVADIQLHM